MQKEKDSSKRIDVFICGNDPKLNKKFYKEALGENVHFPNGTGEEDMYLFSQCDYLIGAPSSYTLIASMYKDSTKLYWIKDSQKKLSETDFEPFKVLFTQFDSCFCAEK